MTLLLMIILICCAQTVIAAPSVTGDRGLFLVQDARTEDAGVFTISSYLLGAKNTQGQYYGDVIAPNITVTPWSFIELFFNSGIVIDSSEIVTPQVWQSKLRHTSYGKTAGVKLSIPYLPVLKLGARASYTWLNSQLPTRRILDYKDGFAWQGFATLQFSQLNSSLPNLLLNYSQDDANREYGAGLELAGSSGAIFVEATSRESQSDKIFTQIRNKVSITPGVRINLNAHSYLSGGVRIDIKNQSEIPDYTAIFGLTLGSQILTPLQPKTGILTGTVTDLNTGNSLVATIRFPEKPKLKPVQTSALNSVFKIDNLPATVLVVEITSPGYQKLTSALNIEVNKISAYDFKLKPLVSYGLIAGNVYDAQNKKPLEASISLTNRAVPEIKSDPNTGAYKTSNIETGVVTIEVKKEGYFAKATTITVETDKVNQVDFALVSSVMRGFFIGRVTDKINAQSVRALISYPNTMLVSVSTDSLTGTFQTELPVGTYPIVISADNYLSQNAIIKIEKDITTEATYELIPTSIKTIITGKVTDKHTNQPVAAQISFPEVSIPIINADSANGIYRAEIPVGSYLLEVKADGYLSQSILVVLEKDKPLDKSFELVKSGMTITLKGVYFEPGKATLKPESYPALQEAVKIMAENPSIKIEIQGHTDNTGSVQLNQRLSQERADAVMSYLVKNLGISPERLTAKGYGPSQPIASNDNAEGRALNRRVDFKILE